MQGESTALHTCVSQQESCCGSERPEGADLRSEAAPASSELSDQNPNLTQSQRGPSEQPRVQQCQGHEEHKKPTNPSQLWDTGAHSKFQGQLSMDL